MFVRLTLLFRAEVEAYKALDPGVRVVILKALCDIRVEVLYRRLSILYCILECFPKGLIALNFALIVQLGHFKVYCELILVL